MPQCGEDVRARELRAYFLWLDAGQPEGRDHEFWNQASDVLIFSYGSNMAASTMKQYCPDAVCYGVASLPGHQLYSGPYRVAISAGSGLDLIGCKSGTTRSGENGQMPHFDCGGMRFRSGRVFEPVHTPLSRQRIKMLLARRKLEN
jgi:hypothetical protein